MFGLTRQRYILLATCIYAVFALAWIFLSDQLLALFTDLSSMVWLSTVKGAFFVAATTTLFYVAMHAVPARHDQRTTGLLNILADSSHSRRRSPWLIYGLTLVLTFGMFALHQTVAIGMHGEPMLILFIFPIVLSSMLGGLWPGLLSTTLAAAWVYFYALEPIGGFRIRNSTELFRLLIFIVNGCAVSILSELLQHAIAKDEKHRRLLDAIVSGTSDAVYVKDLHGRYVMVNQATANYLEKPIEEILGAHDSELFEQTSAQFVIGNDQRILTDGHQQKHEAYLTTSKGKNWCFWPPKVLCWMNMVKCVVSLESRMKFPKVEELKRICIWFYKKLVMRYGSPMPTVNSSLPTHRHVN